MRRLVAITAFALCLAVPLWAQHGGGHGGGGGGGHASFGSGHGGGFSGGGHVGSSGGHVSSGAVGGGHFSGGIHSGPGFSRGYARIPSTRAGLSHGPFLHDRFRGSRFGGSRFRGPRFRGPRFRGPRFRGYGFGNNCYGYGCWGYGYPWWGYYDPWWWDSDSSYNQDYEQDLANANQMNQQSLEEQRMLRQEEADGDQDLYGRRSGPTPNAGTNAEPQGASIMPATVLVFRDRHTREIQNYAIVGQTLWSFAAQHTERIPLADLDLTATVKANDDRGLSFRLPSASEAQ